MLNFILGLVSLVLGIYIMISNEKNYFENAIVVNILILVFTILIPSILMLPILN